jgi:GMP synthase (glutamine-hydrolysing)
MKDAHIKVQRYRRKPVKTNPADNYEIISPLCYLYHDEVRLIGKALGLPDEIIYTRPITPSGLASRCTGKITKERLEALHRADTILCEEFEKYGLADRLYQYFIVVPDIVSVGVKDESRYEGYPAVIRAVTTRDGVTADIGEIPYSVLHAVTNRIITEVPGINRVLYDLSPKPVATIEWE